MIYFGSILRYLFTSMYTLLVNYLNFQPKSFLFSDLFGFVWQRLLSLVQIGEPDSPHEMSQALHDLVDALVIAQ